MGLEVYKAPEANRQFENSFFRMFQASLKNIFEQKKIEGILIGFPKVPADTSLHPDCVLITSNRVIIIDFKNWNDATVYLPNASEFESAKWRTDTGRHVKGGSDYNANPFVQLNKQRHKLENIAGGFINSDVGGIGCLVVFHGDVTVEGEIPGKYSGWFNIADEFSFCDVICDMIDVKSNEKNSPEDMLKRYFAADKYIENYPTFDSDAYILAEEANKKLEAIRKEKDQAVKAYNIQVRENSILKEHGELAEAKSKLVAQKEATIKAKEAELLAAQEDFDEKRKAYEIAMADLEKEAIKAKQESEKTKQEKIKQNTEHEKTLQAKSRERAAAIEYKKASMIERRKKIFGAAFVTIIVIIASAIIIFKIFDNIREEENRKAESDMVIQALIEDKKSGKTCIDVNEAADYMNIKNVCIEYVVGNVAENNTWIFLNRVSNTDFATLISKTDNLITFTDAKNSFLNKRIRVRGTIKYYDGTRYKYHEIIIDDLSQIEILD